MSEKYFNNIGKQWIKVFLTFSCSPDLAQVQQLPAILTQHLRLTTTVSIIRRRDIVEQQVSVLISSVKQIRFTPFTSSVSSQQLILQPDLY